MSSRCILLSACSVALLCAAPGSVRAEQADQPVDRITPVVRVVQKCQGAVVAFMNTKTAKPMGTGVIVDDTGLVVTNAHVVGKNKSLKVQLIDKSEHDAEVLAVRGAYDLALVKLTTSKKLDVLRPCTSDKVYIGEDVIAIGHPYGYSYSISRGILSATGRKLTLPSGGAIEDVYQTDTAINPGNSGGPLMNIGGELIGINFAVRDDAQNIAFTIPVKKVREVLAEYGK